MLATPPLSAEEAAAAAAHPSRRCWTKQQVLELAQLHRAWDHWSVEDELGAGNYVTQATVLEATKAIRTGQIFSLAIPLDRHGPQHGHNTRRCNPQHVMLRSGSDIACGQAEGMAATDDAIYMPLQAATQWDALCHVFWDGRTYNDQGPESVPSSGAIRNSITNFRDRAAGRGVLLDIPRLLGRDWLEPGEAVQADDMEHCCEQQDVTIGEGDFVLVRTGHMKRRIDGGAWRDFAGGPAPGLGVSAADFLCRHRVTAAATDTWGFEVIPYETGDEMRCPVHVLLLVNAGIYIGEMWDLEALATACAADSRYDFFLAAQPLTITGSVGSPINPLAIR